MIVEKIEISFASPDTVGPPVSVDLDLFLHVCITGRSTDTCTYNIVIDM